MDHEDRTDRRNAAIEAGRLLADGDVGAAERCHACGELLHPYPEPEYWMQYPLPGCCVVDGLRFCDDDRKPECIDSHLVKHPTPAAPAAVKTKKRAKKAGGVEERLRERDEAAADLAAELPEERAGLLAVAAEAVAACHAAVLASDGAAAEAAANRYDASIWKLNGGTYHGCKDGANPEAAGTLIELHCSAAPSVVPMWGQSGEFLMESGGVRCLVEVGDGFGSLLDRHFAFHVVDLDRPFISETGYRSHFETAQGGMTVDQVAAAVFAGYLKAHRRYLTAEAQNRHAAKPVRPWLAGMAQPPRRARAIEPVGADDLAEPLPSGFVLVDAVLTKHQAFIVKKWAEAARLKVKAARGAAKAVPARIDAKEEDVAPSPAAESDDYYYEEPPATEAFFKGVRCQIKSVHHPVFAKDIGKKVVVTRVAADTRQVFAHEDRPVTYNINRNGRRVVESDPRCIESIYSMDALRIL